MTGSARGRLISLYLPSSPMMLTDCRFWTERLTTTGSGTSALVPRGPVAKTTLSLPSVTAPPTRTRRSFSSVRRSFTRAHNCMRRTRSHARKGAATLTSYSLPTAPRCSSKTGRERNEIERERTVERVRSEKSSAHGSTQEDVTSLFTRTPGFNTSKKCVCLGSHVPIHRNTKVSSSPQCTQKFT